MFYGDPIEVMDKLARQNRLAVRAEQSGSMLHLFTLAELEINPSLADGLTDPFASTALSNPEHQVVSQYRYVVSLLEAGDETLFRRQMDAIRPPQVGISATQAYESLSRGAIRLFSLLRQFDQGTLGELDHPAMSVTGSASVGRVAGIPQTVMSVGKLEPTLCPGAEEATEKVKILYELPANVKAFVESYFSSRAVKPGTTTGSSVAAAAGTPGQPNVTTATPAGVAAVQPAAAASNPQPVASGATAIATQTGATGLAGGSACASQRSPLRVLDDPTGVVLTGSPYELDLAFRLIRDRDIPSRQVLAEVFLVEVQKDWERVIEASLRGNRANAGAVTTVFSALSSSAAGFAGAQLKPNVGTRDIVAFINLLETNAVGRNISSPTIIARDGEKADLEKKVQLREKVTKTTSNVNGGVNINTTDVRVESLEVPLKLSITPKVNRHNNHVVFLFEYDETILGARSSADQSPIERSTTQNRIKTNVETAPGDVVILAGLFKEANSRSNSAVPGFSEMGILTPLLGGSHNRSTSSSELLVFIKPTVIEPKAFTAQVNSLR
jgi:type II secretory pathway component GspD/PulD (secretin)